MLHGAKGPLAFLRGERLAIAPRGRTACPAGVTGPFQDPYWTGLAAQGSAWGANFLGILKNVLLGALHD
jgi:hypothetical protein